ncbi:hypothetical protein MMC26_000012 [Xylographa opegraphella]|nr:hypothetical protein [Xylographa opegraphella]
MSSSFASDPSDLSELLTRSWHIDAGEKLNARHELVKKHQSVSSIAEHYLRSRIDHHAIGVADDQVPVTTGSASLVSLAIVKIIQVLAESDDFQSDIVTIAKSLNSTTLCEVLRDGRLPYVVLRAFLNLPYDAIARNESETLGKLQDIDEAVLLNEKYIRTRGPRENADGVHLVSIEDLGKICGHIPSDQATTMTIRRMEPPTGGFECLDEKRERTIEICASSQSYCERFHRLTDGILKGLNWNHVFLAGGMALTALIHTNESKDKNPHIQDSDLDIFLYGLDADQANQKVEEIYNVWKNNLPASNQNILVVKNFKTINLIPDYPNRRIQIVLKLFTSPTQVFLGFDLDACAIGFDGARALMLPRCARAIETGYNVFTMDFVWGHYLKGRNASREARIFKYADRGFGLRILPSYAKSLEEGPAIIPVSKIDKVITPNGSLQDNGSQELRELPYLSAPCRKFESREAYRMPAGPEAGLKTLKRVVYLGRDFTNRFCFKNTPLFHPSAAYAKAYPGVWIEEYEARKKHTQERIDKFNELVAEGHEPSPAENQVQELDSKDTSQDPDYRRSLSMLEVFMRRVEARRLVDRKEALFIFGEFENPIDGDTNYYGYSSYTWDSSFSAENLATSLEGENGEYFTTLKQVICAKLQIPYQDFGYAGYLTRRIRQQVYGPDLESVMEKQITIPMMVPYDLENFLLNVLPNLTTGFPTEKGFLIPVHDPNVPLLNSNAPAALPHLHDTGSEEGNLRYWVISNRSMWAGQNRIEDEVFETLWPLFNWFCDNCEGGAVRGCTNPDAVWKMAESVRRRAVQPKVPSHGGADGIGLSTRAAASGKRGLTTAEAMLFRAWVHAEPSYAEWKTRRLGQRRFEEDAYLYPVPDELFWREGDEGQWSGGEVPQWRYVPVDAEAEGRLESRKRKSSDSLVGEGS